MQLFKYWSKYAFAYASMQMHNYPKPNNDQLIISRSKTVNYTRSSQNATNN